MSEILIFPETKKHPRCMFVSNENGHGKREWQAKPNSKHTKSCNFPHEKKIWDINFYG